MKNGYAIVLAALVAVGCDPSAKAQGAGESGMGMQLSQEYETCSASTKCASGLRCAAGQCRAQDAVIIADYHAAAGERAFRAKELERAVAAYAEAVNLYKASGDREPPLWLYCDQGHVLAAARDNQEYAELGARVLHRCARLAPVGSAERERALADLALLGDAGLDPLLLATETADKYLTKAPRMPSADRIKLTVQSSARTSASSHTDFVAELGTPAMRERLLSCWETYAKATRDERMAVTFSFKNRFVRGTYADDDGYKLAMEDAAPATTPAAVAATACAKPVVAELTSGFKGGSGGWDGDITLMLAP